MRYVISVMLLVAAAIHLLPLSGVLGADELTELYGIAIAEPNLAILMRHRAVLLGTLGVLFAVAAFARSLQPLALIAGFVSVGSFLLIAWVEGSYNAQLARVFTADVVALASGSAASAQRPRR